jgi:hypothetical protein
MTAVALSLLGHAKALGLTILPSSILARADEVIE